MSAGYGQRFLPKPFHERAGRWRDVFFAIFWNLIDCSARHCSGIFHFGGFLR
jgi:hypothetical protein